MLKLSKKIKLIIEDDSELFNDIIKVKTLTKKQRDEIQNLVIEAQDVVQEDKEQALELIEKSAKKRFEYQVAKVNDEEKVLKLTEIAELYGYSVIMSEIEAKLSQGK